MTLMKIGWYFVKGLSNIKFYISIFVIEISSKTGNISQKN